ncbi:MAG: hypothetical protein AAFN12_12710 [Cyanobacteria bacterium J06560_2]
MVSPLKTWQHQEPKGLWPALGGLAVVAHVGVVGLSIPYVLRLMQPDGTSSVSVVPIELIDVESPQFDASSATAEPIQPPVQPATEVLKKAEPVTSASDNVLSAQSASSVSTPPTEAKQAESPTSESPVQQTEPPGSEPAPAEPSETSPEPSPSEETPPADNSTPPVAEPEPVPDPQEPSVLPGEDSLPAPEETAGSENTAQVAYLKLADHSYVPEEFFQDVPDTQPSPNYEAVTSLEVNPESLGCGRVDFSQSQVTYRVTVGLDGTLRSAIPWTGSQEAQAMSEGESAIACLITNAGFTFTTATTDGSAVANSDLLLTLDLIESVGN